MPLRFQILVVVEQGFQRLAHVPFDVVACVGLAVAYGADSRDTAGSSAVRLLNDAQDELIFMMVLMTLAAMTRDT